MTDEPTKPLDSPAPLDRYLRYLHEREMRDGKWRETKLAPCRIPKALRVTLAK